MLLCAERSVLGVGQSMGVKVFGMSLGLGIQHF